MKDTRSQSIGVLSRILGVSTDSETNRKLLGDAVDEITVILREDPAGPPIADCPLCGVWTCSTCGWARVNASRKVLQGCGVCGGIDGVMKPIKHRGWLAVAHRRQFEEKS